MGVPPLGPGSPDLSILLQQLAQQVRTGTGTAPTAATAITEDQIAALLQALATPAVAELLSNIEQRILPENPTVVRDLLQAASSAVAAGDVPRALAKVQELVTLSPRQAETVSSEPLLAPIQNEVIQLVRQLTAQVRFQAQGNVATAAQTIATAPLAQMIGTRPLAQTIATAPPAPLFGTQPFAQTPANQPPAQMFGTQPLTAAPAKQPPAPTIATLPFAKATATEGSQKPPDSQIDLRTVLALATRFVESGRLADNLIASELARIVITHSEPPGSTAAPAAPLANDPKAETPFRLLARPEIRELIAVIEERLLPPDPAAPKELLREASSAVAAGDVPRALAKVKEAILADPRQAETIANNPSLQPIQREVANVIRQLLSQVRAEAQQTISTAQQAMGAGGARKLPNAEVAPQNLVTLANSFIDGGRLIDFRIALELAQIALAPYERVRKAGRVARAAKPGATEAAEPVLERLQRAWRRVPLLILLVAWLALGLAFGVGSLLVRKLRPDSFDPSIASFGFSVWAIGFLALVGFGFYMRVRNVRF